ncbi:MAG TPA: hypothetical protein VFU52_00470 [Gaiellaceae bacterium]|jgi:hypothetical protein|nr:hypothetical protein [Gaiellaceae bacterium]
MDEASLNDLRQELAVLEAQEERLSAERERLHHQIDFGFESTTTGEREQEVSAARRDLHQRIDLVRKILNARHVD